PRCSLPLRPSSAFPGLFAVPPCRETGGASLVLSSGSTSFGGSTHASPQTRTHGIVPPRPRRVLRFARGPHPLLPGAEGKIGRSLGTAAQSASATTGARQTRDRFRRSRRQAVRRG